MRNPMFALTVACAVLLNACAEVAPAAAAETPRVAERIEYGVVESIDVVRAHTEAEPPVGAILGGIAGGVIGHQIGGGRGKDVATVAGALGGAYAGNKIQRANEQDVYRITVKLDGGARIAAEETGESSLRAGDRVRVVNGRVHRE